MKVYHFLFSCCYIVKLFIIQHPFSTYQTEFPRYENGRYVYRINRSPMCEYMINFIHKLKHLPEKYMMNSVLENFTILQVGVPVVSWVDTPCAGTWYHCHSLCGCINSLVVNSIKHFQFFTLDLKRDMPTICIFKLKLRALQLFCQFV